jgi:hypothetical protein
MAVSGWFPEAVKRPTTKMNLGNRGLDAVVLHVADGPYEGSADWLWDRVRNPSSSAHGIINNDTGEMQQFVSIHDRAWANGIRWAGPLGFDPQKAWIYPRYKSRMWSRIRPGYDPNAWTISLERSGRPKDPWQDAGFATLIRFLRFVATVTGIVYVPGQTLIGHRDISPINRANCPGPHYDFVRIASLANIREGETHAVYVVTWGPAKVRPTRGTSQPAIRKIGVDQEFEAVAAGVGELVSFAGTTSNQWVDLLGGGSVWAPLVKRVR